MLINEVYRKLKNGCHLSEYECRDLLNSEQSIAPHQWTAFAAFYVGIKVNPSEKKVLDFVFQSFPEVVTYFKYLSHSESESLTFFMKHFLKAVEVKAPLGKKLIDWWVQGIVSKELPLNFIAFCLVRITCRGLHTEDTHLLTCSMAFSGNIYDYRNCKRLNNRKIIRRYPSGALSEKIALILPSLISAVSLEYPVATGFLVARSLGFTGGTWDKLKSVPGFIFPTPGEESIDVIQQCGVAMSVTQKDVNPADRILYQLRSTTGTIESEELILSSIVSKQMTYPADRVLLDLRYGPGAFLNFHQAGKLGKQMVSFLEEKEIPTSFTLTNTPQPTGCSIGNTLEFIEALAIISQDFSQFDERTLIEQQEIVLRFFAILMHDLFPKDSESKWYQKGKSYFYNGVALESFRSILLSHQVTQEDLNIIIENPWKTLLKDQKKVPLRSEKNGHLVDLNQKKLGDLVNFNLGAGGNPYTQKFNVKSGMKLNKRLGDSIEKGEPLAWVYAESVSEQIKQQLASCFIII